MANETPVIRMFPNRPVAPKPEPVVEEVKVEEAAPVAKPKKKAKE